MCIIPSRNHEKKSATIHPSRAKLMDEREFLLRFFPLDERKGKYQGDRVVLQRCARETSDAVRRKKA